MTDSRMRAWYVLDCWSTWVKEFTAALSRLAPTFGLHPEMRRLGRWQEWLTNEEIPDPRIKVLRFPLQHGHMWPILGKVLNEASRIKRRVLSGATYGKDTALICTSQNYAAVAEQWPGPVVYYLTDMGRCYPGANRRLIRSLDRRMARAASLVCPNSRRIADYLRSQAHCDPDKIMIVPNATREINISPEPVWEPGPLPEELHGVSRPIAGVIGNLAENMDWELLVRSARASSWLNWVFVGPTDGEIRDKSQRAARAEMMSACSNALFVGPKPYGSLASFARSFDAAILPYRRREPTFSGSSTRFYEHLAACRPILASRGFEELLHKEPLLHLFSDAEDLTGRLEELRRAGFEDGYESLRWQQSHTETWECRAQAIVDKLERRIE